MACRCPSGRQAQRIPDDDGLEAGVDHVGGGRARVADGVQQAVIGADRQALGSDQVDRSVAHDAQQPAPHAAA